MTRVKEAIEEMIEESYLLGLTEQEIRADFKRFLDTCYAVIEENVKDREAVSGLAEDLAREQTVILIADRAEEGSDLPLEEKTSGKSPVEEFSERAAHRKRQILRIIADYDPQLVCLIDEHRFQGELDSGPVSGSLRRRSTWRFPWRPDWQNLRVQLLKVGYATTIGIIVLLIWLGFMQS
tara:strand:+ start:205 stop:744 length:540 start_codon:yes stop_codon:yes gene_type:complete